MALTSPESSHLIAHHLRLSDVSNDITLIHFKNDKQAVSWQTVKVAYTCIRTKTAKFSMGNHPGSDACLKIQCITGPGISGGGDSLIYIRRLGPFLGVQNFEFQYYYYYYFFFFGGGGVGGSEKQIFSGYEECTNIFGSLQNWTILRGHFYTF